MPGARPKRIPQQFVDDNFTNEKVAGGGATTGWRWVASNFCWPKQTPELWRSDWMSLGKSKFPGFPWKWLQDKNAVWKTICLESLEDTNEKHSLYSWTTWRSLHSCQKEHRASIWRNDGSSALSKHQLLKHASDLRLQWSREGWGSRVRDSSGKVYRMMT